MDGPIKRAIRGIFALTAIVGLVLVSCLDKNESPSEPVETVTIPSLSGPDAGMSGRPLRYSASGAASNLGHSLEYQFAWGDGTPAVWSDSTSRTHVWSSSGSFVVRVRARCKSHARAVSDWGTHALVIASETVSVPSSPAGADTLGINQSSVFTTGGASSSEGHDVQYRFDWGDGTTSDWGGTSSAHSWGSAGTYQVKAIARCRTHTGVRSAWSQAHPVTVVARETVNTPSQPQGPDRATPGQVVSYTSGGATSSHGHAVEYQFDWGDGRQSNWGGATQQVSWTTQGDYTVRARARCRTHTNIVSSWSTGKAVGVHPENVAVPSVPAGPSSDCAGRPLQFRTGGAVSSLGHQVEYQFDWGDGNQSAWGPSTASHVWTGIGSFSVKARARCKTHTSVVSAWSNSVSLQIRETISAPTASIPTRGEVNVPVTAQLCCANSSCGHSLEYVVDWGDGVLSNWGSATSQTHAYAQAGQYTVKARARCAQHPSAVSVWASRSIVIDPPHSVSSPGRPSGPGQLCPDQSGSYSASGATDSRGHSVQYQFDWGDGQQSGWGSASGSHTWSPGSYGVKVRARCTVDPSIVSSWSSSKSVSISETTSIPSRPSGPGSGYPNTSYQFCTSGGSSSCGHPVEYQFDWGDGNLSGWGGSCSGHGWSSPGTYTVRARTRCRVHQNGRSGWSSGHTVVIQSPTETAYLELSLFSKSGCVVDARITNNIGWPVGGSNGLHLVLDDCADTQAPRSPNSSCSNCLQIFQDNLFKNYNWLYVDLPGHMGGVPVDVSCTSVKVQMKGMLENSPSTNSNGFFAGTDRLSDPQPPGTGWQWFESIRTSCSTDYETIADTDLYIAPTGTRLYIWFIEPGGYKDGWICYVKWTFNGWQVPAGRRISGLAPVIIARDHPEYLPENQPPKE